MKYTVIKMVSLAIVLVMIICSLPTEAFSVLAAEEKETLSREWIADVCRDELSFAEKQKRARNVQSDYSLLESSPETNEYAGDITASLDEYIRMLETVYTDLQFFAGSSFSSDFSEEALKRKNAAAQYSGRIGWRFESAYPALIVEDVSLSGDVLSVSAYEWTFIVYNDNGCRDICGYGFEHELTLSSSGAVLMSDTILDDDFAPQQNSQIHINGVQTGAAVTSQPNQTIVSFVYSPDAAIAYADKYALEYNPAYYNYNDYGGDCANFVSQCMYAGGMPMVVGTQYGTDGWFYHSANDRSGTWTSTSRHRVWFSDYGVRIDNPGSAHILKGNPVYYDWDADGAYDHTAICVGTNNAGTKIINAHNVDRYHVNWTLGCTTTSTIQLGNTNALPDSPDAPVLKAASVGYTSVKLTWNPVDGANSYEIYRCDKAGGAYRLIGEAAGGDTSSYIDRTLSTGTTYYFKIRAKLSVLSENIAFSQLSNYASARPIPATPVITAEKSSVSANTVSWVKIFGATGYSVYRSTEKNGTYSLLSGIPSGDTVTYTDKNFDQSQTYYYKVRAFRNMGEDLMFSNYSSTAEVKGVFVPKTPVISARSVGYTSARVEWDAIPGVDGYSVYRCDKGGGTYTFIASVDADTTVYTNTGLSTGTTYYYKVRAFVNSGNDIVFSSYSACATARPIPATPVVTVQRNAFGVTVKWAKIYGATGYSVYRSTEKNGTYSLVEGIPDGSTTSFVDTYAKPGSTYYYKVRAYRKIGNELMFSNYSDIVSCS